MRWSDSPSARRHAARSNEELPTTIPAPRTPAHGAARAELLIVLAHRMPVTELQLPTLLASTPDVFMPELAGLLAEGLVLIEEGWGYVVPDEKAARFAYARASGQRHCRECGCTEDWACDGGCAWAAPDLCDGHAQDGTVSA